MLSNLCKDFPLFLILHDRPVPIMRKAKKEGRWMRAARLGYANKITEDGKKYITSVEPASIMKRVFEKLNEG
ncbi:MAG: hypothetical protein ABIP10_09190 [Ferruginibacter sp.]